MTLIKKCDVEMYLSSRRTRRLHLIQPVGKSVAAVIPVAVMAIESNVSEFSEDFSLEHSSPGGTVSAVVILPESDERAAKMRNTPRSSSRNRT